MNGSPAPASQKLGAKLGRSDDFRSRAGRSAEGSVSNVASNNRNASLPG